MSKYRKGQRLLWIAAYSSFLLGCGIQQAAADDGNIPGTDYHVLKQGWDENAREAFYFTSQGSQLIPYDWFLALEQTDSDRPFHEAKNMDRLRFIPYPKTRRNPDGLPVGFVKDDNPQFVFDFKRAFLGEHAGIEDYPRSNSWMGMTCAACHTAVIEGGEKRHLVDGAPSMADVEVFLEELNHAVKATHTDDAKMERFAKKVLPQGGNNPVEKEALRKSMRAYGTVLENLVKRNASPVRYGFARLDAFGAILNEVCATSLEIPENRKPANAPASYPFLWDTHDLDWVQWNGSASNPMARNVGEVLGVFGHFTLTADNEADQFQSTVRMDNLFRLEEQMDQLSAPPWPQAFGAIDEEKRGRGETLYRENCMGCHSLRDEQGQFALTEPNAQDRRFIKTRMISVTEIGTDPLLVRNFLDHHVKPGKLAALLPEPLQGQESVPRGTLLTIAVRGVMSRKFSEQGRPLDDEQRAAIKGFRDDEVPSFKHVNSYKARPLNGIWATAPYLHNGSVPNLYQLLLPSNKRMKQFHVGSREFDPRHVGFSTEPYEGSFEFNTQDEEGNPIPGNSNAGHEGKSYTQRIGEDGQLRDFTDEERLVLVEFMKTLN